MIFFNVQKAIRDGVFRCLLYCQLYSKHFTNTEFSPTINEPFLKVGYTVDCALSSSNLILGHLLGCNIVNVVFDAAKINSFPNQDVTSTAPVRTPRVTYYKFRDT